MKYIVICIVVIIGSVFFYFSGNNEKIIDNKNDYVMQDPDTDSVSLIEKNDTGEENVEETIYEENALFNPRVAAQAAWHLREKDNQKLYEKLFEIEDELVRREVLLELFYRINEGEDFGSMMIGLVQAGLNTELVLSFAQLLTYDNFDRVYYTVRDMLSERKEKFS